MDGIYGDRLETPINTDVMASCSSEVEVNSDPSNRPSGNSATQGRTVIPRGAKRDTQAQFASVFAQLMRPWGYFHHPR